MDDRMFDLGLSSPWMNAAGFMGYLPQRIERDAFIPGVFVTNPISLQPRSPAHNQTLVEYPGGFLLHTGHPNPGIRHIVKTYNSKWQNLNLPVWLHLLVTSAYDCRQMVMELENLDNVTAFELGLPPGLGVKKQLEIVHTAVGEKPVFVCVPLDEINLTFIDQLPKLGDVGVAICAPRGVMIYQKRSISGRLFGPSLHPQMLAAINRLRGAGLPIVAGCGIYSLEGGEEALAAGASAVQVDGWCWRF